MQTKAAAKAIRTAKLVAVLVFCLVNPLAGWAYLAQAESRSDRDESPIVDTLKSQRIAILPLQGTGAAEVTVRWIECLTESLQSSHGLEVWTAFDLTDGAKSRPPTDFFLDGNCEYENNTVRIHARLILAERNRILWSETFEGHADSIAEWCEQVRRGILSALSLQ